MSDLASDGKLDAVRVGLSRALTAGTGFRVSPYPSDSTPAPCGEIDSDEFDPRMVFGRAKTTYPFIVRFYVGRAAERASFKKLDQLRNPTDGVMSAVENPDNWPDDLVDSAYVTLVGRPGEVTLAGEKYLVCDFNIEVIF